MRTRFLFFSLLTSFLLLSFIAEAQKPIVSSYIRGNFYETGRISDESLLACNDLIYMAARPYTDGSLYFDIPVNNAGMVKVDHLSNYKGRKGVAAFSRKGALMDARTDLLNTPLSREKGSGICKQFTFGTWIYVDRWTRAGILFSKKSGSDQVALTLGATSGELEFGINGKKAVLPVGGLEPKQWHHLVLTYNGEAAPGNQVKFYLDGKALEGVKADPDFPTAVPYMRSKLIVGEGFRGKLDETFICGFQLDSPTISSIMSGGIDFTNWRTAKVLAYWKYDDPSMPGKDSHTWADVVTSIRPKIEGKDIKLRLCIAGGDWKGMVSNETSRVAFARNVKSVLDAYQLDGVDLDFEWPETPREYADYSSAIIRLKEELSPTDIFSVSLHPVAYKITLDAIRAADYVSMQSYGPRPIRFPLPIFKKEAQEAVSYGIPKEKLIMGVPFYGVSKDGKKKTAAYSGFVEAGLIADPFLDEVFYQGTTYLFNGQETIRQKTRYVIDEGIGGIMSWDLGTDTPFDTEHSLLKVMCEEIAK